MLAAMRQLLGFLLYLPEPMQFQKEGKLLSSHILIPEGSILEVSVCVHCIMHP